MGPDDLATVIGMICEHAAYERAAPPDVSVDSLRDALFAPSPPLCGWVAIAGAELVGYMTATRDYATWRGCPYLHMDCLFVRAPFRGAGIGARLMENLCRHAEAEGIDEIQWQTPKWNEHAARFYRRTGATESLKRRFCLDSARNPGPAGRARNA